MVGGLKAKMVRNFLHVCLLIIFAVFTGCSSPAFHIKYNSDKAPQLYAGSLKTVSLNITDNRINRQILNEYRGLGPKPPIWIPIDIIALTRKAVESLMAKNGITVTEKRDIVGVFNIGIEAFEVSFKWGTWIGNVIISTLMIDNKHRFSTTAINKSMGYDSKFNWSGYESGEEALNNAFNKAK